ncbi:small acid-soluble spore protein H (minor) [Alicyclobacillus sacchari]|uniref:Small acid-soluble spore protein H (Minor) n=1 Tax=Alicyclobacillus sacchari TaxID=392010 RepID=A0A4R8LU18_9BACL|nr:small acid-soluble spore protein H (minor) [Alicyclobacillus sacchari]GMA56525.1 small, acid-soluble spore protein H 2 [Alicyclobacillus sacchari]
MLNAHRAKEISESPVMANVTHNGQRIYIQQVDLENETARVYALERPEQEYDVHVSNLVEH